MENQFHGKVVFRSDRDESTMIPAEWWYKSTQEVQLVSEIPSFLAYEVKVDEKRKTKMYLNITFNSAAYMKEDLVALHPIHLKFDFTNKFGNKNHTTITVCIFNKPAGNAKKTRKAKILCRGVLSKCDVCKQGYAIGDDKMKIPRVLSCGHQWCVHCLALNWDDGKVVCDGAELQSGKVCKGTVLEVRQKSLENEPCDDFVTRVQDEQGIKAFMQTKAGKKISESLKSRCSNDIGHAGTMKCNVCDKKFCKDCPGKVKCVNNSYGHNLAIIYNKCTHDLNSKENKQFQCVDDCCTLIKKHFCCIDYANAHHVNHKYYPMEQYRELQEQKQINEEMIPLMEKLREAKDKLSEAMDKVNTFENNLSPRSQEYALVVKHIDKLNGQEAKLLAQENWRKLSRYLKAKYQQKKNMIRGVLKGIEKHMELVNDEERKRRWDDLRRSEELLNEAKEVCDRYPLRKLDNFCWQDILTNPNWEPLPV